MFNDGTILHFKMNYCILYGFGMAILCWPKAKGQTSRNDIVSPSVAETGGTFTVTCDASRAGVPTTATTVANLFITYRRGTINSDLAISRTFIPPYERTYPPPSLPVRNWTYNFEGSLRGTADQPKNRNTMKIELVVRDAKCADAGTYICRGTYMNPNDNEVKSDGFYQNLSISVGRIMSFYLNPMNNTGLGRFESVHRPGSSVTIYCSIEGSNNVTFQWKIGKLNDFSSISLYPALNPIFERVDVEPACSRYRHSSTLKFQIEYNYDGYMFVCVATENNKDTVVGNMTIFTQIGTEAAHTGQRISDQLISPSVVETGGTFTVTCDASRAGVPTTATTVRTLVIEWSDGTQQLKPLARYGHNGTQYEAKRLPQTFPARKWAFRFSGTLQRTSNKPKNRNTMKIEMVLYDAKCTDAGLYFCTAIYQNSNKNVSIINSYQNLTIKARPVFVSLYSNTRDKIGLRPFQSVIRIGSDVDVTCIIEGPKDLNIRWMFGSRLSNFNSFTPYSGSVVEPVEVSSGTTCVQYLYSSTLKFQTEDKYDGYMYVCVVTENNKDKIFGNITVYNKKGTESAYTSQPRSETILKQNVVNVTTSFTVTCDASRAGVPTNATTILSLTIARTDGTKEPTTLADYNTLTSPYESSFQPESSSMKTWFFEFSGRLDGLPYRLNNRNTMKIVMTIRDARCPDEGLYFCTAIYVNSHNDVLMESRYQNITITGGQVYVSFNSFPRPSGLLVDPSFPLKPSVDWKLFSFEKMDFNLTCIVNGSKNVNIHWKFGSSLSNFSSFTPYPEATGEHFLIDSGTTCEWYFHSSTLSFKTEYKYDGYTYVCVATENNRDTIVANMTLNVTQAWEKSDNLIHPKEVKEGGSFNLTCYASHASVPLNITTVTTLYVEWTDGTQNPVLLARYRTYIPPFQYKFPSYFLPTSNRTINFYGNLQGTSDAPNNRNTMKIEIMVHDAKCTDAGVYFCNASFIDSSTASSYQNLTIVAQVVPGSLTLVPQNANGRGPYESFNPVGSNVTLSCNVTGPKNVTLHWWFGGRLRNFSLMPYPVQNVTSVAEPVLVSSETTCVKYLHTSTLNFQMEIKYSSYTYECVATENNRETIVGNMTIYTKQ